MRPPEVLGTDDAVDEPDREVESGRVGEDTGELLRRAVDRVGLGLGQPLADEGDGLVRQVVVRGRSGVGVACLEVGHGISVEFRKRMRKQLLLTRTVQFSYCPSCSTCAVSCSSGNSRSGHRAPVAGGAMNFTPSAVSQQLAVLEREAGVQLLRRSGRRLQLTPQAEVLVAAAGEVLDVLERAQASVESSLTSVQGRCAGSTSSSPQPSP